MHKDEKGCFCCPITGFKFYHCKALLKAMIVMVLWVCGFEWAWHTKMIGHLYQETAHLWRAEADMLAHFSYWLWGGNALIGAMAACIYSQGHCHRGWCEGARFGLLLALLSTGMLMVSYAVMPISFHLFKMWVLGTAIEFIVGGILISWVYGCCCGTHDCKNESSCHK